MFDPQATPSLEEDASPLGLYLHVPFCSTSCDFCAFYQVQSDRKGILSYIDGVRRELELLPPGNRKLDTQFWGGGTPGLLPAGDMLALADGVRERFGSTGREWTVEMAPSSVKADKLQALRDAGVTRISMGVQSLNERLLEALGRQHSRKQALKAYDLIRSFDFPSVNLDLIFAIPGQTEEEWREDIRAVAALGPDHLSTYCLTFEEDTALFIKLQQGKVKLDPERETRYYRAIWEEAAAAGFEQYEISNYAKPGHASQHNINTWRMSEWIGLGPSGASQFGGSRHANTPDLAKWLEGVQRGERGLADRVELTPGLLMEDCLIFGLRMNEGVDISGLERRFGRSVGPEVAGSLELLANEGKGEWMGGRFRLTAEGRMVADAVGGLFLGAFTD